MDRRIPIVTLALIGSCQRDAPPRTPVASRIPPSAPSVRSDDARIAGPAAVAPPPPIVLASPAPAVPSAPAAMRCVARWSDPLSMGPGRGALHVAAHDTQAMVTLPRHRDAYEGMEHPAGDDSDSDAYAYTVVDANRSASPVQSDELRPFRPGLGCGWTSVMAAPEWSNGGWRRWFLGGAWGTAACEPCGGAIGHADTSGVHASYVDTVIPREVAWTSRAGVSIGATSDAWFPDAAACNVGTLVEALVPRGDRLVHRPLVRISRPSELAPDSADAVAIALGATYAVVLWRRNGQQIQFARITLEGELQGAVATLARNTDRGGYPHIGAPAAAFVGDELAVIWAERPVATGPFQLRWVQWNPATGGPPAPTWLNASTQNQLAPSLASDGDRIALAWTEGDTGRRGTVFVAVARGGVSALAHATPLQASATAAANARDPEVAIDGARTWVVWQEFARARDGTMMAGLYDCRE